MPYKSSKYIIIFYANICIEKGGKTLALMKKGAKAFNGKKQKVDVPIYGTFEAYKQMMVHKSKLTDSKRSVDITDKLEYEK